MKVDEAGNVYLAGFRIGQGTGWDFLCIKYRPNGDTAWVRRNYWAGIGADAYRLALDRTGVVVCGYRYDASYNIDIAVIKYSPDGDSLWADVFDGGWQNSDAGLRVASGPNGSSYVAGVVNHEGNNNYMVVAKYLADGTREWVVRYGDTLDYRNDWPYGIVTDEQGNCYVCAHSVSSRDGNSILTVKYAPDGSEVWHTLYTPEQDGTDVCGIALSGTSYVYVVGAGQYPGRFWDCVTIKYDQTLGIAETPGAGHPKLNTVPTVIRGVLNLQVDSRPHSAYRAELIDISGRRVMELQPGANDVSRLAPGVYFVRSADTGKQSVLRRVVITR